MATPTLLGLLWACCLAAGGCTRAPETPHARGLTPVAARATMFTPAAEAAFERGRSLAAQGDNKGAEAAFTAALEAGYAPARVLPALLDVCVATAGWQRAVDYATPYLQLHPGDFQLRYRVASMLLKLGQHERARRELTRVLESAPNFAAAHYLMAITLRDHFRDTRAAATHFSAYHRLSTHGTHGARGNDRRSLL